MTIRDLVPWSRGRDVAVRRGEDNPFLTLHREMNRLFDDIFRSFDLLPFGSDRFFDRIAGNWPRVEVSAPSMANSGTEAVRSRFAAFRGARTLEGSASAMSSGSSQSWHLVIGVRLNLQWA